MQCHGDRKMTPTAFILICHKSALAVCLRDDSIHSNVIRSEEEKKKKENSVIVPSQTS